MKDVVDLRRSTTLPPRRTGSTDPDSGAPATSLLGNPGDPGRQTLLNYAAGAYGARAHRSPRAGGVARDRIPSLTPLLPPMHVRAVSCSAIDTLAVQDEVLAMPGTDSTSVDGGPTAVSLRSLESAEPVLGQTGLSIRHLDPP
jgi:hypothetical protein